MLLYCLYLYSYLFVMYVAHQNQCLTQIASPKTMSYYVIIILILFVCFRNLRIREDTAKYLLNLDVNSPYYDPKTHSMREDPLPDADPNEKFYGVSIMEDFIWLLDL